jgi:hypothetical protein
MRNKQVPCVGEKGKYPRTVREDPGGEKRYSSTLSVTSMLDEGGWSVPRPDHFTPGKETRYELYRRLVGPRAGLDECGKSRPPPEFDRRTVQPIASPYTDCAIPVHVEYRIFKCYSRWYV